MVIIILMKNIRKVITIFCLIIFYCYFININNFPNKILIYNDSKLNYKLCPFLSLKGNIETVSSGKSSKYNLKLTLGNINLKDVELKRTEKIEVVPSRRISRFKNIYKRCCDSRIFRN